MFLYIDIQIKYLYSFQNKKKLIKILCKYIFALSNYAKIPRMNAKNLSTIFMLLIVAIILWIANVIILESLGIQWEWRMYTTIY